MKLQLLLSALTSFSHLFQPKEQLFKSQNLKSPSSILGAMVATGTTTAIESGYPPGQIVFPAEPEKAFMLNAGFYCFATLLFMWKGKKSD